MIQITAGTQLLALIVPATASPATTTFVTDPTHPLQVGWIVYPAGGQVPRHRHCPQPRNVTATAEVLYVRQGRCRLELFTETGQPVREITLGVGDAAVLLAGAHRLTMEQDTVLLEVKQGPYQGPQEKEIF